MEKDLLEKNISKIYLLKFFSMFLILMPVIVPFFNSLGIGMKGVYLIQCIFAVTVFIFEVPSGYIADMLGRKKTLMTAFFLSALGFSLFPFAQNLTHLILAEIILGLGFSLSSGTDTALLYDTLEALKSKKAHVKVLGKSLAFLSMGEGFASLISSLLIYLSFTTRDLAVASAICSWIPFFITFFLFEPPRQKMENEHKENFKYIFKKLFKQSKLLRLIVFNIVFSFSGTLFAVWMFQKYWGNLGIPLFYFGLLWALTNFTVSLSGRYAHKLEKWWGSAWVVAFIGVLPVAGYFGISFVEHTVGVLVCLLFQVCRGVGQVILKDALNKRVTGDFRATANSIAQMGARVFFTILGPFLGFYIDKFGLSSGAFSMGVLYSFIFFFAIIPLIRQRKDFIQFS